MKFRGGKLFCFVRRDTAGLGKKTDFFWLCAKCSEAMRLARAPDGSVVSIPLLGARGDKIGHDAA
jgi:hypothetical protein